MKFTYQKSARMRRVSIVVRSSSEVTVRMPLRVAEDRVRSFVESKKEWVDKTLAKMQKREKKFEGALKLPKGTKSDLRTYKRDAEKLVQEKLREFNKFYGFEYKRVTIRNTHSRWGSCSKRGNLSFSYRIVMLPPELADYLVVHELCHLKELNHSSNFWELVVKSIPDYKKRRKSLRRVRSV